MQFNIYKANIIYGGGPGIPDWTRVKADVSQDYVLGYFESIKIDEQFETQPDNMGCYSKFKIEVSKMKVS